MFWNFFYLLNDFTLFTEKEDRIIQELNDEWWTNYWAFVVYVTRHLRSLPKEIQAKDKYITWM
jgi:hypothetical protein